MDAVDDFFSEIDPSTSEQVADSKKDNNSTRKILARAYEIEISAPANISISAKQQNRIEKLLSDVALILKSGDNGVEDEEKETENKSSGSFYFSSRGDDADTSKEEGEIGKGAVYKSGFDVTLCEDTELKAVGSNEEPTKQIIQMSCWNCEGPHNLADCSLERDQAVIRKNRLEFQKKSGATTGRFQKEKDAKFNKYVPGVISDTLKEALGLRSDEVPPWIYEMRILGYPPGYFRQLLKPTTKLVMYNEQNNECKKRESELEFDASNLVAYPGFNVPLPKDVPDKCAKYGFPPMLPQHAKDNFLTALAFVTGQKVSNGGGDRGGRPDVTRRLVETTTSVGVEEMEISDDDAKPSKIVVSKPSSRNSRSLSKSPSIEDLEEERRILLAQLDGESEPPSKKQRLNNSVNGGAVDRGDEDVVDLVSPDSSPNRDVVDESPTTPKPIPLTSNDSLAGLSQSLSVDAGTPVHLRSLNGSKPRLDQFASGIQPFSAREEIVSQNGRGYKNLKKIISRKSSE